MNSMNVVAVLSGLIIFLLVPGIVTAQCVIWFSKDQQTVAFFRRIRKVLLSLIVLFVLWIVGELKMPSFHG